VNRHRRPVLYALVAVLSVGLFLAVLTLLIRNWSTTDEIRESQVENTKASKVSDETLDRIRDCTTPGRECYERSQKQLAGAVSDVNRVVVLASACSVGLDQHLTIAERQRLISSCVIDRLASNTAP